MRMIFPFNFQTNLQNGAIQMNIKLSRQKKQSRGKKNQKRGKNLNKLNFGKSKNYPGIRK